MAYPYAVVMIASKSRSMCAWCVFAGKKNNFFEISSLATMLAQVFLPSDFVSVGGFHDITVLFWRKSLLELCIVFNYVFN